MVKKANETKKVNEPKKAIEAKKVNEVKEVKEVKENKQCQCSCSCCSCKGKAFAALILVIFIAFGFCLGCGCCHKRNQVAVVDVMALVGKSAQVQALKAEQEAKAAELSAWLQEAQAKVNNEEDQAQKEVLLKQYSEEFAAKREDIRQQYNKKLQALDNNITQLIVNEAKKKGYKLVVAKAYALYGATDITEELAKVIK